MSQDVMLQKRKVAAKTLEGDVVWEPFGGLCSVAVAAYRLRRRCFSAEINREFFELAVRRLQVGIMDDYVEEFEDVPLLSIKVSRWRRFFKEKNGD